MVDKTQIILIMGAMLIFSYLVMNINSILFRNSYIQVESEIQYNAIAAGQDVIDAARWKTFSSIDSYNGFTKKDTVKSVIYTVNASVVYVDLSNTDLVSTNPTDHKKLIVTVTNKNMSKPVTLSYIKNR